MEELVSRSFRINLLLMEIFGFYPPEKSTVLYKIYTYCVYCCFTILIPVLALLHILFDKNISLTQISDSAFLICQIGCFIIKLLPFVKDPNAIKRSIFLIEQPLFSGHNECQEILIKKCLYICQRNSRFFLSFCLVTLVVWAIVPFCMPGNNLPIEIWLPFSYKENTALYCFSYFFVVIGIGNGALSNGVIDSLLAGLMSHATCQLKILKNNLQFLEEHVVEEIENLDYIIYNRELLKSKLLYRKIKECVQHHNAILNFTKIYEKTYSLSLFTQIAASVLVICISCLRLSMVQPFTVTFFAMILFLSTMLIEIFLYCFYGAILFEENNSLTQAIYLGQWYNYNNRTKKALLSIMERSKRPMIITAGKILDLSLETFATVQILRRAYSLLAVLKNYQLD